MLGHKKLKIFLLADGKSPHTQKWVLALLHQGLNLFLFSLNGISDEIKEKQFKGHLKTFAADYLRDGNNSSFNKLSYLTLLPKLKKAIKKFQPDIVHAHYISSYGLLAYLSGFRPYVLSAWGSDIMNFPNKTFIHQGICKLILKNSFKTYATSKLMLDILRNKFQLNNCRQIAFGIDTAIFHPVQRHKEASNTNFIIIKSLLHLYGIDIAIKAFVELLQTNKHFKVKLDIYGDGEQKKNYEKLAGPYLGNQIVFHGKISHREVPAKLRQADVLINISRSESFGVSILEASACGLAIIASNRGGVPETLIDRKTGVILPKLDEEHCLIAMQTYLSRPALIREHGEAGRQFVKNKYEQKVSVALQIAEYNEITKKY